MGWKNLYQQNIGIFFDESPRSVYTKIYLNIRLLIFFLGFFGFLGLLIIKMLDLEIEYFPFIKELRIGPLLISLLIILMWTLVIFFAIRSYSKKTKKIFTLDFFVGISLLVDACVIYLTSVATGGADSSFYHTVYFLIAFHAYYFPTYEIKIFENRRVIKYVFGGGVLSIVVSMLIYFGLERDPLNTINFYVELGLQGITAFSWTLLRNISNERYKKLKEAHERIERTQSALDNLARSMEYVTSIARIQDKKQLEGYLEKICGDIGENLSAEYCSIGLCEGDTIEDFAIWTSFGLSYQTRQKLSEHRLGKLQDTLVGSVLEKHPFPFYWDEKKDGDILDPDNPNIKKLKLKIRYESALAYKNEILQTKELKHMLIVPIYSQCDKNEPIGYIHIVNRLTKDEKLCAYGFPSDDRELMERISSRLAVAFDNFRVHENERALYKEESFFNTLLKENDLDKIFKSILEYLNELLDSRLASLWLPTEDGFNTNRDNCKLVLRSVVVGIRGKQSEADEVLQKKLETRNVFKPKDCYIGYFFKKEKLKRILYEPDISKTIDSWSDLCEEIGTSRFIAIPIWSYSGEEQNNDRKLNNREILGIVCLRPKSEEFRFTQTIEMQLERFAEFIGSHIEQVWFKRRYEQIDVLKDGLEKLQISDLSQFYQKLVAIVKNVLNVETCSLFLLNKKNNSLILKATTIEHAYVKDNYGSMILVEAKDYIDKDIYSYNDKCITGEIFKREVTTLVCNVKENEFFSQNFMEKTKGEHQSLMGSVIVKSNNEKIGVIRCINKIKTGSVLPVFVRGDKQFLELITGIITKFIEIAEMNAERRHFLTRLSHEFFTPLHTLTTQIDYVEKIFSKRIKVLKPHEQFQYLKDQTLYLNYLIRDIDYKFGREANLKSKYDWEKVALYPIIEKIQNLLKPEARVDKNIDIHYLKKGSKELPEMYIDKMRFEQVIFNLLQNAVKYSNRGYHSIQIVNKGEVRKQFKGNTNTSWQLIEIKNWGIEVLEGEREVIFQEYKRGSNLGGIAPSGTGIGLAVSREIIENHEGYLLLTNCHIPVTFSIYLPGYLKKRRPEV